MKLKKIDEINILKIVTFVVRISIKEILLRPFVIIFISKTSKAK